uniref:Uncharacterized protein n=1 Tax=Arsenophonus endosymbiont of Trialeurodes vaporariorum TaxID=235567 RepID=A0A3B0M3U0_9GAMM
MCRDAIRASCRTVCVRFAVKREKVRRLQTIHPIEVKFDRNTTVTNSYTLMRSNILGPPLEAPFLPPCNPMFSKNYGSSRFPIFYCRFERNAKFEDFQHNPHVSIVFRPRYIEPQSLISANNFQKTITPPKKIEIERNGDK